MNITLLTSNDSIWAGYKGFEIDELDDIDIEDYMYGVELRKIDDENDKMQDIIDKMGL